jgi:competence protein ComFC
VAITIFPFVCEILNNIHINNVKNVSLFLKDTIVSFRDFIFPPVCFLCNQRLGSNEDRICDKCWSEFTKINHTAPVYEEIKNRFEDGKVVDGFASCYLFEKEGRFQEAVHLLKYRGIKSIGIKFGIKVGETIIDSPEFSNIDYITPVPLHKLKYRERGYNQSEYLCKGISKILGKEILPKLINRKKYTQSQTKLNLQERRLNVAEAFVLNPKLAAKISGKNILLADDVITTGSTIEAAAQVLKHFDVSRVYAASAGLAK